VYFAFLCREQYATYNIFFLTLLFIYLLLCSIVQYPSLLEHYASQRTFLAIRVRWHTIHSIRSKKYTAFRFGIPLTDNILSRSSVTISTGILSITTLLPTGNSTPYTGFLLPVSDFTTYSVQFFAFSRNTAYCP